MKSYSNSHEETIFKVSPSAINLMKDCPRCFWLHYNKNKKRPDGIFPSLPSGMDRILKEHFDKFMKKGELPPEIKNNKDCEGCKLFTDEEKLKIWRNNFKGVYYKDSGGNVLHGAVDNILTKEDKLIVLDYKTRGFPLKEDTHEHYVDQIDLYNYLLRKNGYKTEDYAFLLFYIPEKVLETGEVVFETTLKKIPVDIKNAEKLFYQAIDILRGPCPKRHEENEFGEETCQWCRLVEED